MIVLVDRHTRRLPWAADVLDAIRRRVWNPRRCHREGGAQALPRRFMTVSKRRWWHAALVAGALAAILGVTSQPAHAELNDTFYSWFAQAPELEKLDVTATAGDSQLVVSWSPVIKYSGSRDIRYLVDVQSSGYSSHAYVGRGGCTVTTPSRAAARPSCVISGLENGRTYYVHVTAAAIEEANLSTVRPIRVGGDLGNPAVVTLCCTPVSPVREILLTDNGEGRGTVSWVQPQDTGGGTDLRYDVTVSPGDLTCSTTSTSCLVTGLKPNTRYVASVTASNRSFTSPLASSAEVLVPPASPEAPSRVRVRLKGASAVLTWKAPANAAASGIIKYVVRSTPRGLTCTSKLRTTCTVAGLKTGVSYSFQVRAAGSTNAGAYSKPTTVVTRPNPQPPVPVPAPLPSAKPAVPVG